MNTKTTLPISTARKKIFEIAKEVQKPNKYYTLTEKGRPKAVIMSAEEFESWEETLEITREFPDLERRVKKINQDIKTGAYKKWASLEEVMKKYGYVASTKDKINYAMGNKIRAKSGKKSK